MAENLIAYPAVVLGRYIYTPASAYSAPGATGTLHGDGKLVELQVTEPLLSDFLSSLSTAQNDLNQRWGGQERPGSKVALA
ncbi:hypothetical protein AB0D14_16805 [Streptomyces sp. NPDC048484]|uniref:hypothetical protein n=1 Tax=Streptomyces sp. NPDC048484 TaxID=3155146 RepID=UPI00342355BC